MIFTRMLPGQATFRRTSASRDPMHIWASPRAADLECIFGIQSRTTCYRAKGTRSTDASTPCTFIDINDSYVIEGSSARSYTASFLLNPHQQL